MAINTYYQNWFKKVKNNCLSLEDWNIINKTYTFLKPFYEVTMMNQSDFSLINQTLYTMDILIKHYKCSKVSFLVTIEALLIGNFIGTISPKPMSFYCHYYKLVYL